VLVLWQLDTGKQQFLPHLSSSIEKLVLSPSGTSYAIKTGDNSVVVLSTTDLKPVTSISSIQARSIDTVTSHVNHKHPSADTGSARPWSVIPATTHPSNLTQLLLAVPSSQRSSYQREYPSAVFLQTYDISSNQHVSRQALTRSNVTEFNVSPQGTRIVEPDITHLVASSEGRWLASIDEWTQPWEDLDAFHVKSSEPAHPSARSVENFMKIWFWDSTRTEWSLITRIDNPHSIPNERSGRVLDIISHPREVKFASLGEDATVRIWAPKPRRRAGVLLKDSAGEALVSWACMMTIRLDSTAFRDQSDTKIGSLSFSADGSVLAVAWIGHADLFNGTVYFIDTMSGKVSFIRNGLYAEGPVRIGFVERCLVVLTSQVLIYDTVDDIVKSVTSTKSRGKDLKNKSLLHSLRNLAIHEKSRTFGITVPVVADESSSSSTNRRNLQSQFALFDPTNCKPLLTWTSAQPITSLISTPAGFAIIDSGLNVRIVTPPGGTIQALTTNIEGSIENQSWIRRTYGAPQVQRKGNQVSNDGLVQPDGLSGREPDADESNSDVDQGDSSVRIYRTQLTDLFDATPSYAMPPISRLFEEVASIALGR
jgi:NET1-associated nuclear protein 1 (U3 small nucleolar RNA-associated protein 17)